ncbi:MAG TPA: tetratricopeptide repeat protein [Vicinamibacteria bacterium]|nr:tetratricopeptide repeat protein [Vicinamibacteria bacterium]
MTPEQVQWGPAAVVLLAGLLLGAGLVFWLRKRGSGLAAPAPPGPPLEQRDLDGRIELLVLQLRELEDTASKRTPGQLARERYALELEAARALQRREGLAPSTPAKKKRKASAAPEAQVASSGPPGPLAARPGLRGFLWGAGTVAGTALLLFLVSRAAKPRPEGGGLTGEAPGPTMGAGTEPAGGEEAQVRAALARNPDDLDARLELSRQLVGKRDLMGVWNETQYVLARAPGHPRALSYQALVRLAMGQGELAERMLKQAIATDPDLLEARQHLAFVYVRLGRRADAETVIAETSRRFPGEGERLKQALARFEDEKGGATPSDPAAEDPHAGVAPPAGSEAATPPARGETGGASVSGVIEADGSVRARIAPGTPVFVTVREAGVEQGPPVAVKRLVASGFPLSFAVGPADSMMGQPLPARMRLDVRADSDGDPMTRPPSDPKARLDGVPAGATGLRLDLR